jgi:iron complex outermembrane receptor protein
MNVKTIVPGLRALPVLILATAAPGAFARESIEEVVISGTRIARDEGTYVGPMTVVEADIIQSDPNYSLADSLSKMPAIGNNGTSRKNSNGGRGANFTDVHQLEPERTLTLYNGHRAVSTIRDTLGLGVDMQAFPVNMIDRVEVLADGASSIYGSDAIAGVINIIPVTEFQGIELSFGAGSPQDDGGDHYDAGILFGFTGDRGYFTAGITAVSDGDVDYQDRDWSEIPILGQIDLGGGDVLTLMGSGIPPQGRAFAGTADIIFEPNAATGESFQAYDTFCFSGDLSLDCILQMNHRFNYNDIPTGVSLLSENRNINIGGVGEFNFDNGTTAYINTNLAYREGRLHFTPLPVADAAGRFTDLLQVPYTHPSIPADALAALRAGQSEACNDPDGDPETPPPSAEEIADCLAAPNFQMYWRGLDMGPRTFDYDVQTLGTTLGLKGEMNLFARDLNWDVWLTVGRSELYENTDGQVNVANLQRAVDPAQCAVDPACPKDEAGNPTLNIFGRSPKSEAEISYATFSDQERTDYEMLHLAAIVSGDVADLPAGPLGLAFGVEYRVESGGVDVSGVVELGDSGGNFAEPTDGDYDVAEAYAELSIPLIDDKPGIDDMSLDLSARFSDYSTFGNEFTYKASLSYSPIQQLRFRGTVGTGYRAPNILELYGGTADSFEAVTDPCNAPITDPVVAENCALAGVPPGFVSPASQLKISQGGNEDLDAETSDSFSIGLVWNPEFAPMQIAVDWYDVEIDDAIGTPVAGDVITGCYTSPQLSSPDCARIGRGATGAVVRFDLLNENLATVETSGIDFSANYQLSTGFGEIDFEWLMNYLDEYVETTANGVVSDRTDQVAGLLSDWAAYPEWRSTFSATLLRDMWSVGVTWRYLDEMEVFDAVGVGTLEPEADAINYFDLLGTYNMGAWSLTGGIQNLTDEEPPYVPDTSNNTSGVYDYLGRFYFARATVSWQ